MRSVPRDKNALFDLAVTGPIAGAAVSIIVILIGLNLSEVNSIQSGLSEGAAIQMEGSSILYLFLKWLTFGKLLPHPPNLSGFPLFRFWINYFFTGEPFPWGAMDVLLHPVAWAGWAGFLVTGINLIPAGQLDGGHIFLSMFGKRNARRILPLIVGGLITLGFFWNGWWLWAGLIFLFGQRSAETLDQITELDDKRRIVGYLALALFLLTFIPVPITVAGL
jgi:membrane-associated protease RseP (regulator of RpoE activity)